MGAELIPVAIVEDHPVFRHGLSQVIDAAPTTTLVATASSVEEFEGLVTEQIGVVLLDLHLPGVEGPEAVRRLCARGHTVVVLSAAGSRDTVLDALAAGAHGYVTKQAETTEIEAAIIAVAAGQTFVSPTLASYLLHAARGDSPGRQIELSEREKQVLTLLAQGEKDIDIARTLFIGVRTVHSHLERIRDKTGFRRRADLTRLAMEQGLAPPPSRRHPEQDGA